MYVLKIRFNNEMLKNETSVLDVSKKVQIFVSDITNQFCATWNKVIMIFK